MGDADLARRLRTGTPAVIARLRDGKVALDVRTIFPGQEPGLIKVVGRVLAAAGEG